MHPSAYELEEYALDRLPEPRLSEVKEHLLICDECRRELEATNDLIAFLLAAERSRHDES